MWRTIEKHVHETRRAGGAHEGHAERAGAVQGFLDLGHDFEGLVCCAQSSLKLW